MFLFECCSTATKKVKKKEKASFDSFFLLGLPRKISNRITSSWLISTRLFLPLCCSQIHTQLHTRYKLLSNKNAIFTITRNDHDSCRRRHGAFCYSYFAFVFVFVSGGVVFRDERRVLCLWWISWIKRDGLKIPPTKTNLFLSLSLSRAAAAARSLTTNN